MSQKKTGKYTNLGGSAVLELNQSAITPKGPFRAPGDHVLQNVVTNDPVSPSEENTNKKHQTRLKQLYSGVSQDHFYQIW